MDSSLKTHREIYMTTGDVAKQFNCCPNSVNTWCDKGLIKFIRTPGGHRRVKRTAIVKMFQRRAK